MRKAIRLFLVIPIFVLIVICSGALMNAQTVTADPQTTAQPNPPTVAEAEAVHSRRRDPAQRPHREGQPRLLGAVQLHHRRHRADGGRRQRSAHRRHHRAGQAGHALRPPPAARRAGAQDAAAEALGRRSCARAERSQRAGRDGAHRDLARGRLRQRQVLPEDGQARGRVSRHHRHRTHHGQQHRSRRTERPVGRLAHHRSADARPLYALGRAGQQGRARDGLQRPRRHVARRIRHDARPVFAGGRAPVAAGEAALRFAARLRAHQAGGEVWPDGGGRERHDPRRPAGQSLGAGVGQHLSRWSRRRSRSSRTTSPNC